MFTQIYQGMKKIMAKPCDNQAFFPVVSKPKYTLLQKLGYGASAEVYAAKKTSIYRGGQYKCAIKICPFRTIEEIEAERGLQKQKLAEKAKRMERIKAQYEAGELEFLIDSIVTTKRSTSYVLSLEDYVQELRALHRAQGGRKRDKFLINCIARFQLEQQVWIVTECMETSLRNMLTVYGREAKRNKTFGLIDTSLIVQEVLLALKYLRERRVIHRDIKPENILLSNTGRLKLCDFGIAVVVAEGETNCYC